MQGWSQWRSYMMPGQNLNGMTALKRLKILPSWIPSRRTSTCSPKDRLTAVLSEWSLEKGDTNDHVTSAQITERAHEVATPWVEWAQTRDWEAETQPCKRVNGLTAETHTALCKSWMKTTHTWPMLTKTRSNFELHRTDYSLRRDRQLAVQNHQEGKANKNTKT